MSQKVAVVTNALEFAGPPAVRALLDAGFRVLAHDRGFIDAARRVPYERDTPGVAALVAQSPTEIVEEAWARDRRIDLLLSNDAWPAIHGPIASADVMDLRQTLEQLVVFPFELARAAIPRLVAQPGARVVMITSNRTRLPVAGGAIPDAARAAANALVKSLSLELAPHGVPVNAIAPNFLYSETYFPRARFVDDAAGRAYVERTVPVGRLGRPEEIGELVRFLATAEGTFMTGSVIEFSGGWPAAQPRPA